MSNTNTEEWGNIELPGLSDDELFKKNWNRVAAGSENKNNEKLLKLAERKKQDPNFSLTMQQVSAKRDENYYLKLKQGIESRDNTYQSRSNQRPEVRKKISESLKARTKTQEHLDKVAEKNRARSKPIHTPYGLFPSRKLAAEYMTNLGIINAGKKLDRFLRTDKENYFYK